MFWFLIGLGAVFAAITVIAAYLGWALKGGETDIYFAATLLALVATSITLLAASESAQTGWPMLGIVGTVVAAVFAAVAGSKRYNRTKSQ